jgi:hypothetical protein
MGIFSCSIRMKVIPVSGFMCLSDADGTTPSFGFGRTLGIPLEWFLHLLHRNPEQREKVELRRDGLNWDELDEDISMAGLLAGRADQTVARRAAA